MIRILYIYILFMYIYICIAHESNHIISYNHMVCVLYIYIHIISITRLCHIVICLTCFLQVCQVDSDAGLVVDAQTDSSAPIAELDCSHLANEEEVMGVLVIWGDPLYECQITIKAPETIDVHAINMGV